MSYSSNQQAAGQAIAGYAGAMTTGLANAKPEVFSVGSAVERLKQLSGEQQDSINRIQSASNSLTGCSPPKDNSAKPSPVPNSRIDELRQLIEWFEANNLTLSMIADTLSRGV